MRILHVIDSLDPRCGGPPAVALRLAAAQASQGADTAILSYQTFGGEERIATSMTAIPGIHRVAKVLVAVVKP